MILSPKESGRFISENAKHVTISNNGIQQLGTKILQAIKSGEVTKTEFHNVELHPKASDPWAVDWIFVVDTLNFCFWTPNLNEVDAGRNQWAVNGEVGYFALCAAINRAMQEKIDILNPEYLSTITLKDLERILRPDENCHEIPLLKRRVDSLHEIGNVLTKKFGKTFKTCIKQANGSAVNLLNIIIENFPNFRDTSTYLDTNVSFYKRAQILVGDIWSCYQNEEYFHDIDEITMFADYRVPQVLKYFGVLEYSTELEELLKSEQLLSPGSDYENEIRGCSIEAIEQLKKWVQKKDTGVKVNSILLDQYLWELRRKIVQELVGVPFHRVISIYY